MKFLGRRLALEDLFMGSRSSKLIGMALGKEFRLGKMLQLN